MEKIEESATIMAAPEVVYDWMSNLSNWHAFVGDYTNVKNDPIAVGGEWDVITRVLGLKLTTHFVRTAQEPARWVTMRMEGDASGELTTRFEAASEGQTRLVQSLEFEARKGMFAGVANAMISRAVRGELARTVAAVKRGVEGGQ